MEVNEETTRKQSLSAYNQWCVQWRAHATDAKRFPMKSLNDFQNTGIGRPVVCVANGFSFEANLETLKKYADQVDILACDKTIKHLIDNGITPKFCMLCDANVSYEKYLEPIKDKLSNTILFSNVCGNIKWRDELWKDIYFFVNEDVLKSEVEFCELSGCKNVIPAATNVSNAMVVLMCLSDNKGRKNFFGYDKVLVVGYDYCWNPKLKYYAFNKDGHGKSNYMRHVMLLDKSGSLVYTSTNLLFSMEWLKKYVTVFNLPVVNCSESSILELKNSATLESQIDYNYKHSDKFKVTNLFNERLKVMEAKKLIESELRVIAEDHFYHFLATV